jgi:hypothetical protein
MLTGQQNLTLYHASYTTVDTVDLGLCKKRNDFGQGFYLTTSREQAERFVRTSVLKSGTLSSRGYVNRYSYGSFENLRGHEFLTADRDWLDCVCANRRYEQLRDLAAEWDKYDVLIGKIANDDTMATINIYLIDGYGPAGSGEAAKTAIRLLRPERLKDQICLKTPKALVPLVFLDAEAVELR